MRSRIACEGTRTGRKQHRPQWASPPPPSSLPRTSPPSPSPRASSGSTRVPLTYVSCVVKEPVPTTAISRTQFFGRTTASRESRGVSQLPIGRSINLYLFYLLVSPSSPDVCYIARYIVECAEKSNPWTSARRNTTASITEWRLSFCPRCTGTLRRRERNRDVVATLATTLWNTPNHVDAKPVSFPPCNSLAPLESADLARRRPDPSFSAFVHLPFLHRMNGRWKVFHSKRIRVLALWIREDDPCVYSRWQQPNPS